MRRLASICLIVTGCAAGDGAPNAAAPALRGDSALDGSYRGTVTSISPGACGQAGGVVVITVANGALSMPVTGGQNEVRGKVNADGSISDVTFFSRSFTGSSTGTGQVADGRISLQLQTFRTGGHVPCNFSYAASKAT